jgi:hypothetical protein
MSTIEHAGAIEPDNLGIQPTPRRVDRRSVRRYRIRDRVLARVRARALDRAVAEGIATDTSPALLLHARTLTHPSVARELGQQLCRIVQEAHEPRHMPGMRVMGAARERVLAAEDDLRVLASRLQSGKPIAAQGIAKVHLLLSDGTGPLFHRGSDRNLSEAIREATSALS